MKVPLLAVVRAGAAVLVGAAVAGAAVVVGAAPNCKVLCVLGACVAGELVLVVDGADQFPNRDLMAGCAAF